MTERTTKDQALAAKEVLEKKYALQPWFKKITLDTDDHGYLLDVRITSRASMEATGEKVLGKVGTVKVCFISTG